MRLEMMNDQMKQELFAQMHILLDAGLDMSRMFEILLDEYKGRKEHDLLSILFNDIVGGSTLKEAMLQSGEFNVLDFNVAGVGEASGRLAYTMRFLSEYYMKKVSQSKALRSALSYPFMILCFAVVVLAFMLIVIVPTFSQVYSRMGGELPALTQVLIRMSSNAPVVLTVSAIVLSSIFAFCWSQRKTDGFQRIRSSLLMSVPLISGIAKSDAQCTFCRLMYLLASSGVSMLDSLDMVSRSMTISHYREAIMEISDKVRCGAPLSSCMSDYPLLFTGRLTSLIRVGEESNRLADMFGRSADLLSENIDSSFKSLSTYIEPLMVTLVGGIVAIILIAMYLPMFRIGMIIS